MAVDEDNDAFRLRTTGVFKDGGAESGVTLTQRRAVGTLGVLNSQWAVAMDFIKKTPFHFNTGGELSGINEVEFIGVVLQNSSDLYSSASHTEMELKLARDMTFCR